MESTLDTLRSMLVDLAALPEDFDQNADLYLELGVPSVKAMELLFRLEEQFGISVPDDQFVEATSLAKLGQMIVALKG